MRVILLSDVHANLVALEAVLAAVPPHDAVWVMGDTVGYGPDPSDTLALLRERGATVVAGNHDLAVATGEGLGAFNPAAAAAAKLHRAWLSPEERDALAALPLVLRTGGATCFHGSLRDPVWEYVFDVRSAAATLERAETDLCCNGHTHVPAIFERAGAGARLVRPRADETYPLGATALVNPGSVGQPRDGDARASWAMLDTDARTVEFRRTAYDVAETQGRIRDRGLPGFLADRLAAGL
ncbi:MAG TPA: metallophosphoesterase family protein [Candidatus Limnocylindria bacterium]|nr:metallophosphoesterase family protein [Candidatus Limnocylindria bacterium]